MAGARRGRERGFGAREKREEAREEGGRETSLSRDPAPKFPSRTFPFERLPRRLLKSGRD